MSYSQFDALNAIRERRVQQDMKETVASMAAYQEVLERVRTTIANEHSAELGATLGSAEGEQTLRNLISRYIVLENLSVPGITAAELQEKIYQDMAGMSILVPYLRDPDVEEININSYNRLEIIYSDRTEYPNISFASPTDAMDVIVKMVRMGGKLIDGHDPKVDSHIGNGTRISAMIPPLVPEELGVVASIRKQNKATITKEELIRGDCATEEMLDFLTMCLCRGLSIGLSGATGSGKTTDQAFLLNSYIEKNDNINSRLYVVEDTRELCLHDEIPGRPGERSRVTYTLTKPEPNPVTMRDLIKLALRFHPQIIVPSEVRDGAALEAAIAGITGHVILTSLHANSAYDAYMRLLSMAAMADMGLSEHIMLRYIADAWPIMAFKKRLPDGSRKFMEIYESTGLDENGRIQGQMLYRFVTDSIENNENGTIRKVHGHYECVNRLSPMHEQALLDNGVSKAELDALFRIGRLN